MSRTLRLSAAALIVLVAGAPSRALTPELVRAGERATALVKATGGGRAGRQLGSAFCVSRSGVFLTTASVADSAEGGVLELVLAVGEAEQRSVDATVIRSDRESNVAVLQAEAAGGLTPLQMAATGDFYATMPITAFGYPDRGRLGPGRQDLPAVTVNTGRVTSLEKRGGDLSRILTDAQLVRGEAGGPILDDDGHVVGIIDSEVNPARTGGAIPLVRFQKLSSEPVVMLMPQAIAYDKRGQINRFMVSVVSFTGAAAEYVAELSLSSGGGLRRTLTAPVRDGSCTFEFVPEAATGDEPVIVSARFGDGTVSGRSSGSKVRVGGRQVGLNEVRRIERHADGAAAVTLASGEQLSGEVEGLSAVSLQMGETSVTVDLTRAASVIVENPRRSVAAIEYTLSVRLKDQLVSRQSGIIPVDGAPPAGGLRRLSDVPQIVDFGKVAAATPSATPVQTPLAGGNGGGPIQIRGSNLRDVVGFAYEMATWDDRSIIRRLIPLYGRPPASLPAKVLMAREGYVVGGILVDSDQYTHAFRVIFMRLENGRVDPQDNYLSDWIGDVVSGLPPKQLAGHGEHVVGVCGRKGLNMDAVGLLVLP